MSLMKELTTAVQRIKKELDAENVDIEFRDKHLEIVVYFLEGAGVRNALFDYRAISDYTAVQWADEVIAVIKEQTV